MFEKKSSELDVKDDQIKREKLSEIIYGTDNTH